MKRIAAALCCALLCLGCVGERIPGDNSTTLDTLGDDRCLLLNGEGQLDENRACQRVECYAGFADCDGNNANGCEVSLSESVSHCGACGRACGPGESCVDRSCVCGGAMACGEDLVCCMGSCVEATDARCACGDQAEGCGVGEACCADSCENVLSNNNHCGSCGSPCALGETCVDGNCLCEPMSLCRPIPEGQPSRCGPDVSDAACPCKEGFQHCNPDGTSACLDLHGEPVLEYFVGTGNEISNNGIDDNCDGQIDL